MDEKNWKNDGIKNTVATNRDKNGRKIEKNAPGKSKNIQINDNKKSDL